MDVPDFSKGPLAVSGVVISATPGSSWRPRDRLASLLPVVPTTQREFSADQAVTAFLRVYQPGRNPLAPVLVRARILDGQDAEVFTSSDRLDPARFGSARAADYTLSLPLVSLPGGEYLLNLEIVTAPPAAAPRTNVRRPPNPQGRPLRGLVISSPSSTIHTVGQARRCQRQWARRRRARRIPGRADAPGGSR